jgi:hypothetical protein
MLLNFLFSGERGNSGEIYSNKFRHQELSVALISHRQREREGQNGR